MSPAPCGEGMDRTSDRVLAGELATVMGILALAAAVVFAIQRM